MGGFAYIFTHPAHFEIFQLTKCSLNGELSLAIGEGGEGGWGDEAIGGGTKDIGGVEPRPEQLKTNFVKNYLHFDRFPFLETGLIEIGKLPGELSRQMGFSLHPELEHSILTISLIFLVD